jgi:hypothetical protein
MPVIYVTGGNPIVSPVLTLTSPVTDNTPDFTLAGDLAAADVTRFQYANNSSFTGATDITHTITAPEDAANSFNFSTGALANGTWYFRARVERPVIGNSGWSNTVSETIATSSLNAATLAWVNEVNALAGSSVVSTTQQTNVDALVVGMIADGSFALMDRVWLFAGESVSHQARVDLIHPTTSTKLVVTGTPAAFNVGGYKGDASTFFINSGFTPSTNGVNFLLNTASMGTYEQTYVTDSNYKMGSFSLSNNVMGNHINSVGQSFSLNGGNASVTDSSFATGCWIISRPSGATLNLYRNGGASPLGGSQAAAATALDNVNFGILSRGLGGTFDSRSAAQLSIAFVGGALSAAQATALANRFNDYMIAWNRNQFNQHVTTTALDPAHTVSGMTLSPDNLIIQNSIGVIGFSRSVASASTGKKWCEMTFVASGAGNSGIGISNGTANFSTMPYLGNDNNSIGYLVDGTVRLNNGVVTTLATYGPGDVITMEADLGAHTVQFAKNGGAMSSTINITALGTAVPLYPTVSPDQGGSLLIINFGASWSTRTPTSGYGVW